MKTKNYLILIALLFCVTSSCTKTPNASIEKKYFTETIYSVSIYGWGPKSPNPLKNGPILLSLKSIEQLQEIMRESQASKYIFSISGYRDLFADVKTENKDLKLRISLSSIIDLTNKKWYKVSNEHHIEWLSNLVNSIVETGRYEETK